jgi:hypothetical protein
MKVIKYIIINLVSVPGTDLTNYGSGSTSQKVTVPTVPVPQHWASMTFRNTVRICGSGFVIYLLIFVSYDSVKID